MPFYDYQCDACGHKDEEYRRIHAESVPEGCPKCHAPATYRRRIGIPHTDIKEFHTPIEMHSIGLNHIEDIRDFQRRCPGVPISDNPRDPNFGVPIARNRKEKLAALKAAGFVERN